MPTTKIKARGTSKGSMSRRGWKSGMADHIWKEKGNHQFLWNEVNIINREEHRRIRCLKEAAHMLLIKQHICY